MCLLEYAETHTERAVLERNSQATLGTAVDENAHTWTDSVRASVHGTDRDLPPISLNLAFSMPNARSTHMRVDECLRLNHTSSFARGMPMGPILNGVMHQLKRVYPRSATM